MRIHLSRQTIIQFAAAVMVSVAAPVAYAQSQLRLIPQPREMRVGESVSIPRGVVITSAANDDDRFAASDLADALKERRIRVTPGSASSAGAAFRIALMRSQSPAAQTLLRRNSVAFDGAMRDEGYAIIGDVNRLTVIGATAAGLFYGAQTVKQLIDGEGSDARIYPVTIRDWPAMRYRGFHDDLSRGPVPTLDFQKKQIRTLAAYKVNFFSPYFEHTLEYLSNPLAAAPGGAMTAPQIRELVAYAAHYHIDIIPEQEAFGHLHHVLKYELYSPLGETPHGHVLAPDSPVRFHSSASSSPRSILSSPATSFTSAPTRPSSSGVDRPRTE